MTARRESPLPSRWVRSRVAGVPAYVVQCSKRDDLGRKLYRLRFTFDGLLLTSSKTWTREELEQRVRFLKRKPHDFRVRKEVQG